MKQSAAPNAVALLVALISVSALLRTADAAVGRTPGAFRVSPSGSATYSIPLWAPPGPQGIQPHLALTYDSRAGNSPFGVGWSLSGLSSITRCNRTVAQDSGAAPITLTSGASGDRFCLDGKRLRLTSSENLSTYGQPGTTTTYQTEAADFSNITANGTAGTGPASFTVQGRDGLTYQYGVTDSNGYGANSQVLASGSSTVLSWLLSKVTDRNGNSLAVNYVTQTGAAVPGTVYWTLSGAGSTSYNYTIQFTYSNTNAPASSTYGYVAGTPISNTSLLVNIRISNGVNLVKAYVPTFQASATTGRYRLTQMQECADASMTNCLPPTTISYQNGQKGVATSTSTVPGGSGNIVQYDFNGDGRPDVVYRGTGGIWYVALNTSSGFGSPINTGISGAAVFGDVLGTGSDGILANTSGTFYYYRYNSGTNSFTGVTAGLAYNSSYSQYALADLNGDGLPDLLAVNFQVGLSTKVLAFANTSSNGTPQFSSTAYTAYTSTLGNVLYAPVLAVNSGLSDESRRALDFNADGRTDVVLQVDQYFSQGDYDLYTNIELLSNGTNQPFTAVNLPSGKNKANVFFANWNDDACTDAVLGLTVYISGCNGTLPTTFTLSGNPTILAAMDWDGDGRTDLIIPNGSTLGVYLSTGNGVSSLQSTTVPYSASYTWFFVFDANADGLDALGYTASGQVVYRAHNGTGQPPDLLSSVTDGYGNSASPTYVSIARGNYSEYSDATYPYQNYIGPLYVVSQATFSDPTSATGGTYNQQFWYYGAWQNLQGRGFQGFYAFRTLDSRTGLYHYQYYERSFPYTGMEFEDLVSTGTFYPTQTINTLAPLVTLDATAYNQRYFPYFGNSVTSKKELGGLENGDLITTISTSFSYDHFGNATSIVRVVTDNDPGSPYIGQSWTTNITLTPDIGINQSADLAAWCLPLLDSAVVTYSSTLSSSASVTRTQQFTPDATNCRYTQIVTEPSSPTYKVTEGLTYDAFGNVHTDTVTGINMTARQRTLTWGTTGQFPMSVTDATNARTQYDYNFNYGLRSSVTDPNGLSTSWQYTDGFGRRTRENRPDGTYTTWTYNACASDGGCLLGNQTLAVDYNVRNTDASLQTQGTTYFDELERPLLSKKLMLASGAFSRNELRYDNLGRVSKQAAPCTWSSVTTTCPYWTTAHYDVVNRVSDVERPISSTNSTLQTTTYAYQGRTTIVTDPQTNARTLVSDANGWMRQTKDPYGYTVTLVYDAAGSRTGVTDSLGNTLWTGTVKYGVAPLVVNASDMDLGAWIFTYNALGERTNWSDAKGQTFSEAYDALSRPLTRSEPDLFTQWTWGSSAASHNIGQLQSVCTGTGNNPANCTGSPGYAEAETYDSTGRLYQRAITVPAIGIFTYTWQYNATSGLLDTLTYPVSTSSYALKVKYGYQNGLLQSVTDVSDTPNVNMWQANTANPAGQVTQETLGNGIVTNRPYDAVTHWVGSITSGIGGGAGVQNLGFLYDEMGNVTQRQDNNHSLTENVYYDNDYRFSYSKLNGTQNLLVTYDGSGNITSRTDIAGGASWTYDPVRKHAVTQAGSSAYQYSYDANGNAMTRQGSLIAWSSYNYPTSASAGSGSTAETVSFAYGPDRQRWQQSYVGNGTNETTYYVGGLLELVVIGSADYRHYIYAGGEPVAVYSRKSTGVNTFSYLLSDHQGSVASITSSSGAQVIGESFTAFGNRRNPSTWSGPAANSDLTTIAGITRQGYTFQTALGLWMGLNHMNGRVQDAVTGRFLSADPYVPNPGSTQSYNRFSYVGNNPVSAIDPTGFLTSLAPVPKLEEVTVTGTQGPQDPGLLPGDLGGAVGGTARGIDDIETITVKGHKRQMIPCLPGVDCYVPQGNPKSTQPNQPCSSLGSLECGVCVNTYLNNTYGNFGGFIASTFNAQQVIPGLSGRSLFNTLVPSAEIGIGKFGASQLLQYGGDFIAMNTSGSAGFWAGTSIEYGGAVLPQVLAVIGAATTPFATVATSLARSACGG